MFNQNILKPIKIAGKKLKIDSYVNVRELIDSFCFSFVKRLLQLPVVSMSILFLYRGFTMTQMVNELL